MKDGLGGIMLSEINQTEKDQYHMFYLYTEPKEQNKRTKQRQIHRYRTDWWWPGGRGIWGTGSER